MSKKIFAILFLSLLIVVPFTAIMSSRGDVGVGDWITSYRVIDSKTGQTLVDVDFPSGKFLNYSSILARTDIMVTFTISVPLTAPGNLQLTTALERSTTVANKFWDQVSGGSLGDGFELNDPSTEFNYVKGTYTLSCYGKTPNATTPTYSTFVRISSSEGEVLDQIRLPVYTVVATEFQTVYNQKANKLQSLIDAGVPSGYTQLYANVLSQAASLANKGYVNDAIALLNSIPTSGEPMGSALQMIMLPLIVIGIVAAGIFAFLFLKARGKNSYTLMVIEDQIKDLEGLTLRAARIDRGLSANLESVRERLKNLVGM